MSRCTPSVCDVTSPSHVCKDRSSSAYELNGAPLSVRNALRIYHDAVLEEELRARAQEREDEKRLLIKGTISQLNALYIQLHELMGWDKPAEISTPEMATAYRTAATAALADKQEEPPVTPEPVAEKPLLCPCVKGGKCLG